MPADLDDDGLRAYLSTLADEVDARVPDRPVAAPSAPTRRRWLVPAGIAAAVALLAFGLLTQWQDDPRSVDTVGDPTSTTAPPGDPAPTNASLEVVPSTDLGDGDIVELRLDGEELLDGTDLAVCTGDAVEAGLFANCDLGAVIGADGTRYAELRAEDGLRVSVSRVLQITRGSDDPNVPEPYDCATEPTGCILAVGDVLEPSIDVSAPLEFTPGALAEPELVLDPSSGLRDGDEVTVTGSRLRPNSILFLNQCSADLDVDLNCDGEYVEVRTDEDGRFSVRVSVATAVYGYDGRTDCVVTACTIRAIDTINAPQTGPIRFAPGTIAPVPALTVSPAGPYEDRQIVTVRGTGFQPGRDLAGDIGQCPAHLDTAVNERCGYNSSLLGKLLVGEDGSFEVEVELYQNLSAGTCVGPPGCLIAWVIQNGPIAASASLTFSG